ncbi:MAG: hypothetical protein KDA96_23835, partial [Planctomycetaceae bacterium]|nr:hypothetical protein [Planctomycetaceae bacterium]
QHPVLAMLAGRDQIIDNQRTRERLQTFGTRRMTIVEYPFATHTLEFDLHRSDFVNDLIHWLGAATKKKNESCLTA